MIVGVFLRYIKTYQGINYIPLTDEDRFCGLVGINGIGKSSILEALDCFFNGKQWNLNIVTKKSGKSSTKPQIVPVFLLKKTELSGDLLEKAEIISELAINIKEDNVSPSVKSHLKKFIQHRDNLIQKIDIKDYLLLPLGIDYNCNPSVSIFNCKLLAEKIDPNSSNQGLSSLPDSELKAFEPIIKKIKKLIEYIYIPREIDTESFTKLETDEIQVLMGETLNQILEKRVPSSQITEINKSLNHFINNLSSELELYSYRTPTDRQQNLKKHDVYKLIIQAFFNIRKLHKKQGDNWLEISSLSSGEKQKAIIDVAHSLINRRRNSGANLIIGVDEPKSSLHMSACFDQFDALYEISRSCRQVLFSSHWYGFFPTIETGSAAIITKNDNEHCVDLINLASYREQVRQMVEGSRGRLPYDIRLKSINDFVQSVITSSIGDNPFNWIICEGSSEKIYFSAYFSDILETKRIRIVPVGGAKEIKRLYNHIATSYEEFKNEISGKIILITNTDRELVRYKTKDLDNLICKRIVNCQNSKETKLINIDSNPVSPKTEIEDALNGRLFHETLLSFEAEFPEMLGFLTEVDVNLDECSFFALDIKSSQSQLIEKFFDSDNNKYNFAKKYADRLNENYVTPKWIQEIRSWLT